MRFSWRNFILFNII